MALFPGATLFPSNSPPLFPDDTGNVYTVAGGGILSAEALGIPRLTSPGTITTIRAAGAIAAPGVVYTQEVLGDAPRAYYRMSEASGLPQDASGNGNHSTESFASGVSYAQTGPITSDPLDRAISAPAFDFRVPDHSTLDLGDTFSLECWVKRSSSTVDEFLLCKGTGAYALRILPSGNLQLTRFAVADIVESTVAVSADGLFHHLVATKNGATAKLYIDGVDRTGSVFNSTSADTATSLSLGSDGADGGSQLKFGGTLDEIAIYPTALSAARVLAHYQAATASSVFGQPRLGKFQLFVRGVGRIDSQEIVSHLAQLAPLVAPAGAGLFLAVETPPILTMGDAQLYTATAGDVTLYAASGADRSLYAAEASADALYAESLSDPGQVYALSGSEAALYSVAISDADAAI